MNLLYLYASLFLSYFIFHWLIRIRRVNLLFTYTTFTRLYPRYHEPETRLRELGGTAETDHHPEVPADR